MNYYNYFTEIEETFIRRRGKHLLLSPLDWALIESWQEREIPLRIVLRGLESVFDSLEKNPNRKLNVKSLTYCRDAVEGQYANWLKTQIGKSNAGEEAVEKGVAIKEESEDSNQQSLFSDDVIKCHLQDSIRSLETAKAKSIGTLRQVLDQVSKKLSEYLRTNADAESLEESLNVLEELIDSTLLEATDGNSLEASKKEVAKELSKHKASMEKGVYDRTFDLMLLKNLREKAEVPRLSLFYL